MACVMRQVGTGNVAIIFMYVIKCIMVSIVRDICTDKGMTLCAQWYNNWSKNKKTNHVLWENKLLFREWGPSWSLQSQNVCVVES
jgi:hypothetical protein